MHSTDDIEPIHREHHDLRAWREGIDLAEHVYRLVANHPDLDEVGLGGRMREVASAIPAEIAAGNGSGSTEEFLQRLAAAERKVAAFESHLAMLRRLELVSEMRLEVLDFKISEVARLIRALRQRHEGRRKAS